MSFAVATSQAAVRVGLLSGPVPTPEAQEAVLATLVSGVYRQAGPAQRALLLECLIGVLRPLGLVAVASGAFGNFLSRFPWQHLSVSAEEALRYSADQVYELARFVEQVEPQALGRLAGLIVESPALLGTLTASLLLTALRLWAPAGFSAVVKDTATAPLQPGAATATPASQPPLPS